MYRIAFFGSDKFSLASFKAVHRLLACKPSVVGELELCVRKLKPSGRGMREIKVPSLVEYAAQNNLKWHEIEERSDFENLVSMNKFNLAIAVSYGNLVPNSFLNKMQFGGLNVHPSLLPAYRGSSPVQAAIRNEEKVTGVSIQTLHPTKFDRGDVLKQTEVIINPRETTSSLTARLAEIGANDLCSVLESTDLSNYTPVVTNKVPSLAPKLDSSLARIDFTQPWQRVDALGRALGKLYFLQTCTPSKKRKGGSVLRVNLADFCIVNRVSNTSSIPGIDLGYTHDNVPLVAVKVLNGYLGASKVTVQNFKPESPENYFRNLSSRSLGNLQ